MALDFPSAPTVGQKYPQPPVSGMPVYTWDGEKWTTIGGTLDTGGAGTALPLVNATPALVGSSTKYAREDHVHPTDLSRAVFDALAYNSIVINGGMQVSQELGGGGRTTNGFICDGWRLNWNGTMAGTAAQSAAAIFPGFTHCLALSISTAEAVLAAGEYAQIMQFIEGWRIARLAWGTANAKPITIGFWTAHHRTGLWSGSVRNGGSARSYVFTYTQAAADVAQYNTVTIPGDTTGTWPTDTTAGMILTFAVASGATYIAPAANTWYGANYMAAPGQVNGVGATSDVFRLTGVVMLPGTEAPSASRSALLMRPFDQELTTCKRYWNRMQSLIVSGYSPNALYTYHAFTFPEMRAIPTLACTVTSNNSTGGPTFTTVNVNTCFCNVQNYGAADYYSIFGITLDARL
jgi:hypothetical protein